MKKIRFLSAIVAVVICSFTLGKQTTAYHTHYLNALSSFEDADRELYSKIKNSDCVSPVDKSRIKEEISRVRLKLKGIDIWLRYLEPVAYNKINGPLAVEWENEVFEKFEKPYHREGAGLSLAELYLDNTIINKDTLLGLIDRSFIAIKTYEADSIIGQLDTFDHFFLANRLYLLNLAAVYTTGFECPNPKSVIPELRSMLANVKSIYTVFNQSFPGTPLTNDYLALYDRMISFVNAQPSDHTRFDHYTFIKDYVNPLFAINQKLINAYNVISKSYNDYTLNNDAPSIFDKTLYTPQNSKGIFSLVNDPVTLEEIKHIGKLLFYDPILSGNNQRSCISCHKSTQYFTDTTAPTSMQFNKQDRLPRNTPSLVNVIYNHLLMLDGKHISLQAQGKAVMTNPIEMGGNEQDIMTKVLSCKEYKTAFKKFAKLTPEAKNITFDHIVSAITYYYSEFSNYYAPFDEAMNNNKSISQESIKGFNLFMGKARCATCHFVPQFNGVKPPYISSEFEVLGVPADTSYQKLSADRGRYEVNPADETLNAFRTSSIRNSAYTKPYMHNGVFNTLEQVIEFYDAGGGVGKKLSVANQTLSADSLKLTPSEKKELISFMHSLNEKIIFQKPPETLPVSANKELNNRKVGGEY
jgi:cytochrome c peroxidase